MENVYRILQQIYSGNGVQNFIRIAQVLWKALQKTFWFLLSGHTVQTVVTVSHLYSPHLRKSSSRR